LLLKGKAAIFLFSKTEFKREMASDLDDKASPELVRTMLQHSFQYAHLEALQHMRHVKKQFIVLAQHLDETAMNSLCSDKINRGMHDQLVTSMRR
jgi:hypothetical protein